ASGLPDAATEVGDFFSRFVEILCPPSRRLTPWLPGERDRDEPQLLHLATEFARALGVGPDLACVSFQPPQRVQRRVARRIQKVNPGKRPIVVLHPGPSWPVR